MTRPPAGLLARVYEHFGAHRVVDRDRHEIDRIVQRCVISAAVGLVSVWHEPMPPGPLNSLIDAVPGMALAYVLLSLAYWRVLRRRPDAAVGAQYAFLLVDPMVTVLALAAAPEMLAPLNIFLMVQIVRCGIRYGVRTLWLTWVVSALASAVLLPLSPFWTFSQPLSQSHLAMLAITPLLFAPLISRLHRSTDELRLAATSDPLTGLGNRRMLAVHLQMARQRARRDGTALALVLFDLDRFKAVNDAHGHARGDELLLRIATGLQDTLRGGDFLARIGGDEFVLLVEGLSSTEADRQAAALARHIAGLVETVSRETCPDQPVSASVGVQCWTSAELDQVDADQMIDRADRAMYAVKRATRPPFARTVSG